MIQSFQKWLIIGGVMKKMNKAMKVYITRFITSVAFSVLVLSSELSLMKTILIVGLYIFSGMLNKLSGFLIGQKYEI